MTLIVLASSESPHSETLAQLAADPAVILPSMLLCDFAHLADEVRALEEAGAQALHLDIMDGHFVDNMTYGLTLVETFRRLTDKVIDSHLMIGNPADYVEKYVEAGSDFVTIHAEAVDDPRPVLAAIRRAGAKAGIAINPPTPVAAIADCLDLCDLVLVMSVMPGFGGQAFDRVALDKLAELREQLDDDVVLQVDGGVNTNTIGDCGTAGANWFVVGSGVFKSESYTESLAQLRALALRS